MRLRVRTRSRRSLGVAAVAVAMSATVILAVGADRGPAAVAPRPAASPVGVIQRYLAALAAHDAAGVCRTFSARLQAYLRAWDGGPNCRARVARSHWSSYSPGDRVTDIRIVRLGRRGLDRYGNFAVHLILWFNYSCVGDVGPIPGCKPGFQKRRNTIYLRRFGRRWLIVKPGQVYGDTDSTATPDWYDPSTPPGDSSMVNRLARLPGPLPPCAASRFGAEGRARALVSDDGRRRVPFAAAPWLDVRRLDVTRTGRQFCVALLLGAPPRVDTQYAFDIDQADAGGELGDEFSLAIDATGAVHARLTDPSTHRSSAKAACRTAYGMDGDTLEMVITARFIKPDRSALASASSASLQPGEPLLAHPLDAGDTTPSFYGLRLARSDRRLSACAIG